MKQGARFAAIALLVGLAVFLAVIGEGALREIDSLSEPGNPHKDLSVGVALRTHLHNKAIHLPICLAFAALGLSAASFRNVHLEALARWCVLLGFAAAIGAVATGLGQAGVYEGGGKEWIVVAHRAAGYATMASLGVWAILAWIRPLRLWAFFLGLVTIMLITLTGFLGGIVAHG
jgi:uncharacterized membrane protein